MQGLSTGTRHQLRPEFIIAKRYQRLGHVEIFYIEMVCGRMLGLGRDGMISKNELNNKKLFFIFISQLLDPPILDETFTLVTADLCTFDRTVFGLIQDLTILHGMAESMEEDQRGFRALYTANQMINTISQDRRPEDTIGKRLVFH